MVAQLLLCNNCVLIVTIIGIVPAPLSLSPSIRNHGRTWNIDAASNIGESQPGSHQQQLKGHQGAS